VLTKSSQQNIAPFVLSETSAFQKSQTSGVFRTD